MAIANGNMNKKSDRELMQLVVDRNTKAFKTLYQRYELPIYNFILRYTAKRELAQDLLQETFIRIWIAAHTFNLDKGNFKGWLFTIALNITRSEMSKKQYSFQYLDVAEMKSNDQEKSHLSTEQPEKNYDQMELKEKIQQALSTLPPYLREVVVLKHYQQLKFKEISLITNTPEGTIKSRFFRAMEILKQKLNLTEKKYATSQ